MIDKERKITTQTNTPFETKTPSLILEYFNYKNTPMKTIPPTINQVSGKESLTLRSKSANRKYRLYQQPKSIFKTQTSLTTRRVINHLGIYEKEIERARIKDRKLLDERAMKNQIELDQLQSYPLMSDNSRMLLIHRQNKSIDIPHYMEEKKIKEKNTGNLKVLIKNETNVNNKKKKVFNQTKFDSFLKNNEKMIKNKDKRAVQKSIEYDEEIYQFAPTINKKSEVIARNASFIKLNRPNSSLDCIVVKSKLVREVKRRNNETNISHSPYIGKSTTMRKTGDETYKDTKNSIEKKVLQTPSTARTNFHAYINATSTSCTKRVITQTKPKLQKRNMNKSDRYDPKNDLYHLNIRANLSTQDEHNQVTLNKKHNGILSFFLS